MKITNQTSRFSGMELMEVIKRQEQEKNGTKTLGVLLTYPIDPYLESELSSRFTLYHLPRTPFSYPLSFSSSIRAVVCNTVVGADASLIDVLPSLEIVTTFSVGLDKVDLDKCRERGISVTNTPDVLTDDVADLAVGLAVAVLRRICLGDEWVRKGEWGRKGEFPLARKFSGSSVGIVGMGRIGTAIANRVEAFGCTISYHSKSRKPNLNHKHFDTISELATNCGILFVACPLTEETYHLINRDVIEALGPEGVVVNIGRGSLVDEDELVSALAEGRLGGAGLDVFEHEPEPPEKLYGLKNVVLLPHVGSSTFETCKVMTDLVIANLEAHVLGKPLLTPVL